MTGQGQLARVAELCRDAEPATRRAVSKALRVSSEPMKEEVREAARSTLPRKGGLNDLIASSRITTRTSLRGGNPSVKLTGKLSGHDLRAIDRGRLAHPVFGNKGVWVTQSVPPGFWTKTMKRERVRNRRAIVFALEDVSRMVAGG